MVCSFFSTNFFRITSFSLTKHHKKLTSFVYLFPSDKTKYLMDIRYHHVWDLLGRQRNVSLNIAIGLDQKWFPHPAGSHQGDRFSQVFPIFWACDVLLWRLHDWEQEKCLRNWCCWSYGNGQLITGRMMSADVVFWIIMIIARTSEMKMTTNSVQLL